MASVSSPSRRKAVAVALVLLASYATAGCSILSKRFGEPIPVADADLRERVTTVAQAVNALGPPIRMTALPGGMAMLYEYLDGRERQIGINLTFIGLDWFKFAFGRGAASRQALLLVFDEAGILMAQDFHAWTEDMGSGFGMQLFVTVLPTVDTRHLWVAPEQHHWGQLALERLPVTLNAGQSVVSGTHGLEMRGSPSAVGQRSLEMEQKNRRR